jgi:xylulokinase
MGAKYFLTCDIGTSVTKSVIYKENFEAFASASEENPTMHPKACWHEEDPNQWWLSIKKEIRSLVKKIDSNDIIGAATCGQMHAPILVDERGNPLFCSLSWPDGRTVKLVEEIREKLGVHQPYFTSTAPKLLWIKRNYPEIIDRTYKILLPKDFIRMKLSDTFCTDTVDAGGTAMYNSENNTWNWEIIDYIGLDHDKLPEVFPSEKVVGSITKNAAEETNLVSNIPIITGTGDFGIGRKIERASIDKGDILLYLGTGPGIWWVSGDEPFGGRSRSTLSILGVAGTMPQWFKNNFYDAEYLTVNDKSNIFEILDSEAENIEPGSEGLIILPHLMGERSYGGRTYSEEGKFNPYARGVFFGLCMGHTRTHIFRAIREGITYHLKLCWEHIQDQNPGSSSDLIVTTGGGSKSRLWRQIIADIFNLPVCRLEELETSTLGLACLISVALGKYDNFKEASNKVKNKKIDKTTPDKRKHKKYSKIYDIYKELEIGLEPLFETSYN